MSTQLDLLVQLRMQLINFLDELIETFPGENDFLVYRIMIKDRLPITDIMDYVVKYVCPLQEAVRTKNDETILNHNIIFGKLSEKGMAKVARYKKIWQQIDQEDKNTIWRWVSSFINIGLKYAEVSKESLP
jgi:hypothetical protein